jgi:hypothetical protein
LRALVVARNTATASHRNVRDVRNAPHSGETRGFCPLICPTTEAEYFSAEGWTGVIGLMALAKIDFRRSDFLADPPTARRSMRDPA